MSDTGGRRVAKRSITVAGHRTSISLEDAFWDALAEIAGQLGMSIAAVVADVDRKRGSALSLSAALRLYVLDWYRKDTGR